MQTLPPQKKITIPLDNRLLMMVDELEMLQVERLALEAVYTEYECEAASASVQRKKQLKKVFERLERDQLLVMKQINVYHAVVYARVREAIRPRRSTIRPKVTALKTVKH